MRWRVIRQTQRSACFRAAITLLNWLVDRKRVPSNDVSLAVQIGSATDPFKGQDSYVTPNGQLIVNVRKLMQKPHMKKMMAELRRFGQVRERLAVRRAEGEGMSKQPKPVQNVPPPGFGLGDDPLAGIDKEYRALLEERDKLRAFAIGVVKASRGYSLDECDVEEIAVAHGLLVKVAATEPCGETCACAECADFPTECYRPTPLLTGEKGFGNE